MAKTEEFTYYQPLGNSDPAYTACAPGGLSDDTPAMTPLMPDASTGKLVAWDGAAAGTATGMLALAAGKNDTELTFYKTGTFRFEDVSWPSGANIVTRRNAFAGSAISITAPVSGDEPSS